MSTDRRTATDPIVQAVAEALHADQCPDDECDGGHMGEWERQAEIAVAAARSLGVQAVFPDATVLGEGQCCPDVCNGGACETCPSCCAGWCINGHDFTEGVWESMNEEDRRIWLDVASEHSPALAAARPLITAEALREASEAWLHGAWGDTPRHADRIADRMGATQYAGDWLRGRADDLEAGQ